jgi:glucose/arabinose dehydrogenase
MYRPTAMAFAPDGRLFICEQDGRLRVIKDGVLLPTPFLSVVVDSREERGMVGVALDPDFSNNQYVYVYYTTYIPTPPTFFNRVSRFKADGDVALPGSEVVILKLSNLTGMGIHNGGALHFGPDGKLYIATGDNGDSANAQTLSNLLGKILRINSDGTIPSDNPFFNTASGENRAIWALGFRNPFTFAFQPGTNRMFINDVGGSAWEEINEGIAGSNYGWPGCEGFCSSPQPDFHNPLFTYAHGQNERSECAITGGTFYDPQSDQFPDKYRGKYFFSDFCSGWIHIFDPSNNRVTTFATGITKPVDLQVSSDGSLYYLAMRKGSVFRVQYSANIDHSGGATNHSIRKARKKRVRTVRSRRLALRRSNTVGRRRALILRARPLRAARGRRPPPPPQPLPTRRRNFVSESRRISASRRARARRLAIRARARARSRGRPPAARLDGRETFITQRVDARSRQRGHARRRQRSSFRRGVRHSRTHFTG